MKKQVTKVRGMSPLQALIVERMRVRGWDAKQVEARGVTHATLHRYMNPVHLRQLPRRSVIQALALALEIDESEVREAAVASLTGVMARPEWRASCGPFRVASGLDVTVLVERIDRLSITGEDLEEGLEAIGKHFSPSKRSRGAAASSPADYVIARREGDPLKRRAQGADEAG